MNDVEKIHAEILKVSMWEAGAMPDSIKHGFEMQRRQVLAQLEIALQLARLHDLIDARTSEE